MAAPTVVLKPKRAQPFFARHPWVFAGAIERVVGEPADGAEVDLHSSAGNFIARGLFNSQSKIRVQLYSWEPGLAIEEHGLSFLVNIAEGQKTGFYHDQRDNRHTAARLAAGRRVLDAFCYTGGFGLHAARAGAASVECVDVSESALALGRRNAERNGISQVTFTRADVFKFLDAQVKGEQKYGLVVLDPPKFARSRGSIPEAMRGYRQ